MKHRHFITAIITLLVFLFTYTAVDKLLHLQRNIAIFSHLPFARYFPAFAATALPLVELFVVALLLFPRRRTAGLYSSLFLFIIFTLYLLAMMVSRTRLPCTCGGIIQKMTWHQHLLFNLVFVVLIFIAIRIAKPVPFVPGKTLSHNH